MRIHPREQPTRMAQNKIVLAVYKELENHDLTDGEYVQVMAGAFHEVLAGWAKYVIREERHGNTDTPGGLAE